MAPDKNSVAIPTIRNWAAQPDVGNQKVIMLTSIKRLKNITMAKTKKTKKIAIWAGLFWMKKGGFKMAKSKVASTAAKLIFNALLEISRVNQYLK